MHWHEAKAKQLHSRMQGAYSHLRRSAYNTGSGSSPADDLDGIRIKLSLSPTSPILTAPHDCPLADMPGAYSQASFSGLSSSSPRLARFIGISHLGAGWRSQEAVPWCQEAS